MKILSWNCHGPRYDNAKETKKWQNNINWIKSTYKADLYVIQECSKLQVDLVRDAKIFNYAAWYGDDIDYFMRGTAIFSDERYFTEREEFFHNPNFRYVVPYRIQSKEENLDFILFNVWTKARPQKKEYREKPYFFYENNVKKAVKYYHDLQRISPKNYYIPNESILIGDFNFGKDVSYVKNYFSKFLSDYDYSVAEGLIHNLSTFVMKKDENEKKYFNDFCFSKNLNVKLLEAGSFSAIENRSDHIPLLFEVTKI